MQWNLTLTAFSTISKSSNGFVRSRFMLNNIFNRKFNTGSKAIIFKHELLANSVRLFATKSSTNYSKNKKKGDAYSNDINGLIDESASAAAISWYPGHIAKAEKELGEYLSKVDVVIEVRDCRIPLSTTHPKVPEWVGTRPLIVAMARLDQVSKRSLEEWKEYYAMHPIYPNRPNTKVFFVDGKLGTGVLSLKKEALKAGITINERRQRRGIQPRAVRAAVIGYPNVGKSALINRLLGRKMAKSRNLPGVCFGLC
jgi:GTP-binding protein EngB required for normal cell division